MPYIIGNKKTFWGFTSTSSNPKTTYNFLKEEEKIKVGTLFILGGDIWGYDITLFNYFGEEEILLEPEKKFIIDNVLPPLNEVINVSCTLLETPLILDKNKEIIESDFIDNPEEDKILKLRAKDNNKEINIPDIIDTSKEDKNVKQIIEDNKTREYEEEIPKAICGCFII